jgi:hypothetical protein
MLGQAAASRRSTASEILLVRAQEWVDTWNKKDVARMRALHADDISGQKRLEGRSRS